MHLKHPSGSQNQTGVHLFRRTAGCFLPAAARVRQGGFYFVALERGLCSERALVMTLAGIYVQGVSTSLSEHETCWNTLLKSLTERGMHGVQRAIRDDYYELGSALRFKPHHPSAYPEDSVHPY